MNDDTKKRYSQLAEHFYKTKITGDITPQKIVNGLVDNAEQYRPDYFRRLRNALAYDQEERGYKKAAIKINKTVNPVTDKTIKNNSLIKKPKERRVKSVSEDDYLKIVRAANIRGDNVLAAAVILSKEIGCRPAELFNMRSMGSRIWIEGAKKSKNLRGLDRMIQLDDDEKTIGVRLAIDMLQAFNKQSSHCKSKPHELLQARLAAVTKRLWPRRKARPTFYSFRHQMGANLKSSGMSRSEVAYIMGHQATSSVDVYGDKRTGDSTRIGIKASVTADRIAEVVRENHTAPPVAVKVAQKIKVNNDSEFSFGF